MLNLVDLLVMEIFFLLVTPYDLTPRLSAGLIRALISHFVLPAMRNLLPPGIS